MPLGIGYGTYGMPPGNTGVTGGLPQLAPAPAAPMPPGMTPTPAPQGLGVNTDQMGLAGTLGQPGPQINDPQLAQMLAGKTPEELARLVMDQKFKKAGLPAGPPQ